MSFSITFFSGYIPSSGIVGPCGSFIPSFFKESPYCSPTSLVAQMLKRLPGMWETWVRPLGWEDPLEKAMATRSSVLAWRIPGTAEPGGLPSMGSHRVGHD